MIKTINEMIDFIDDFMAHDEKATVVGGIAGTQIEKIVIDRVTAVYDFNSTLILNAVQDYVYMCKPIDNVKYWADVFTEDFVNPPGYMSDEFKSKIFMPKSCKRLRLNTKLTARYDALVVYNAQLLEREVVDILLDNFCGKIIFVTDPIETGAQMINYTLHISDYPILIDSLEKTSPMIALARKTIGIETLAVDSNVPGDYVTMDKIKEKHFKSNNTIVVTSDYDLYEKYQNMQYDTGIKKGNKLTVVDHHIFSMKGDNDSIIGTISYGSLLIVDDPKGSPLMKHKLWNTKFIYATDVIYDRFSSMGITKEGSIKVRPANVIMPIDVPYHRYENLIYIKNKDDDYDHKTDSRNIYTMLKCANNVTVVNKVK